MCPELKITAGHVSAGTLLFLDLIRSHFEGTLSSHQVALEASCCGGVLEKHQNLARTVNQVGHWCSVVRWSENQAASAVASFELGLLAAPFAVGFFPAALALRAASAALERLAGMSAYHALDRRPNVFFDIGVSV